CRQISPLFHYTTLFRSSMSRRIAAELYNAIIAIKPEWHSDDLKKGKIKVIMTSASSDGPALAKFHTTKDQRRMLAERMKDPNDEDRKSTRLNSSHVKIS